MDAAKLPNELVQEAPEEAVVLRLSLNVVVVPTGDASEDLPGPRPVHHLLLQVVGVAAAPLRHHVLHGGQHPARVEDGDDGHVRQTPPSLAVQVHLDHVLGRLRPISCRLLLRGAQVLRYVPQGYRLSIVVFKKRLNTVESRI